MWRRSRHARGEFCTGNRVRVCGTHPMRSGTIAIHRKSQTRRAAANSTHLYGGAVQHTVWGFRWMAIHFVLDAVATRFSTPPPRPSPASQGRGIQIKLPLGEWHSDCDADDFLPPPDSFPQGREHIIAILTKFYIAILSKFYTIINFPGV